MVFYAFGAAGFLWNVLWVLLVGAAAPPRDYHMVITSPGKDAPGRSSSAEELCEEKGEMSSSSSSGGGSRRPAAAAAAAAAGGGGGTSRVSPQVAWQLLQSPPVWALVAAHVSYTWGHYLVLSWLPTWLNERHGVSRESMGLSTIPFAAMAGGVAAWSWVADRWSLPSLPNHRPEGAEAPRAFEASPRTLLNPKTKPHVPFLTFRRLPGLIPTQGMTTIGLGGAAVFFVAVGQAGSPGSAVFFMSLTLMLQVRPRELLLDWCCAALLVNARSDVTS